MTIHRLSLKAPLHPKNEIIETIIPPHITNTAASPIDVLPFIIFKIFYLHFLSKVKLNNEGNCRIVFILLLIPILCKFFVFIVFIAAKILSRAKNIIRTYNLKIIGITIKTKKSYNCHY